ncbi:unnamed protein product [Aphanomyces euteiches]
MLLTTPVPDDFFECPPLSAKEIQDFRELGIAAMHDLLELTKLQGGPADWTLVKNGPKVQIYMTKHNDIPTYLGTTQIESTLEEMQAIFSSVTTAQARGVIADYFPNLRDMVCLYDLTDRVANVPHHTLTINWVLLTSPLRGVIVKNRDWCYVEHNQDVVIDGKKAWIRAFKHVDIAACPDLEAKYGIIRGHMVLAGFIYIETDRPGILKVLEFHHNNHLGQLDVGMIADFMVTKTAEIQYNSMNMMQNNLHSHRLSCLDFLPSHSLVPKHSRAKCAVCLRNFSTFTRKSNCRGVARYALDLLHGSSLTCTGDMQ